MILVVIVQCPHCGLKQMTEKRFVGISQVCAKCHRIFSSSAMSQPFPWARPVWSLDIFSNFEIPISAGLFESGIRIPVVNQQAFISHTVGLTLGKERIVSLVIGKAFPVRLVYQLYKNQGPSLSFQWIPKSGIVSALSELMPEEFGRFVLKNNNATSTRIVQVGVGNVIGQFLMKILPVANTKSSQINGEQGPVRDEDVVKANSDFLDDLVVGV